MNETYRGYTIAVKEHKQTLRRPAMFDVTASLPDVPMPVFLSLGHISYEIAVLAMKQRINQEFVEQAGQELYNALQLVCSLCPAVAERAEAALTTWEAGAVPYILETELDGLLGELTAKQEEGDRFYVLADDLNLTPGGPFHFLVRIVAGSATIHEQRFATGRDWQRRQIAHEGLSAHPGPDTILVKLVKGITAAWDDNPGQPMPVSCTESEWEEIIAPDNRDVMLFYGGQELRISYKMAACNLPAALLIGETD